MNEYKGPCDLHIHSNFSDSDADIESIFNYAKEKNMRCLAITDHDTVSGLSKALSLSRSLNMEFIEGIEFSAQHRNSEVHILGYFINSTNEKLIDQLAVIKDLRKERILIMADKLNGLGLSVDKDEFLSRLTNTVATRLHLALYLVEKNQVRSLKEVFGKFLSPGRPAYQSRLKHSVKDVVRMIKDVGGLTFIAHPHMLIDQSWVQEFIGFGLDGLEVSYPGMSEARSSMYSNIATKHNLLKSGGSDAHGSYKAYTSIGCVDVPYQWVQEMKNRLASVELA